MSQFNMSVHWDFRAILECNPDGPGRFNCVGKNKKGERCGNFYISGSDKAQAAQLLDKMDTLKKLSSSYEYLEELAELTLCPRWHRDKPGNCQVQSVTRNWQRMIAVYAAKVDRAKEKAALIKNEQKLAKIKRESDDMEVKLERKDKTIGKTSSKANRIISVSTTYDKAESRTEPDFPKAIPKPATGIITPPASSHSTQSRISTGTTKLKTEPTTTLSLPSPPSSPLRPDEIKQENSSPPSPTQAQSSQLRHSVTSTKSSSIKVIAKADSNDQEPKTITPEKTKVGIFDFEFPPTPDTTPSFKQGNITLTGVNEAIGFAYEFGVGKQVSFPHLDQGCTSKLSTSIPRFENSPSSHGEQKHLKGARDKSALRSNPEYKVPSKSFDFPTPTKLSYAMRLPEKPSTVWDDFNMQADKKYELRCGDENMITSKEKSESTKQPQTTAFNAAPVHSNLSPMIPEATPETCSQLASVDMNVEKSYGYVIVTPVSVRYKTYLPSHQQRHGLITPSEKSETRVNDLQDSFLTFTSSSVTAILQNPLPSPSKPQPHDEQAAECEMCGTRDDECHCDENSGREYERDGCFHSSRLRRLRKSIVRKVNTVRTRVAGAIHQKSDSC